MAKFCPFIQKDCREDCALLRGSVKNKDAMCAYSDIAGRLGQFYDMQRANMMHPKPRRVIDVPEVDMAVEDPEEKE